MSSVFASGDGLKFLINVSPSNPSLTDETRRELVRRSIDDMARAISIYRKVEADATASMSDRKEARDRLMYRQMDFGAQWGNVLAILEANK